MTLSGSLPIANETNKAFQLPASPSPHHRHLEMLLTAESRSRLLTFYVPKQWFASHPTETGVLAFRLVRLVHHYTAPLFWFHTQEVFFGLLVGSGSSLSVQRGHSCHTDVSFQDSWQVVVLTAFPQIGILAFSRCLVRLVSWIKLPRVWATGVTDKIRIYEFPSQVKDQSWNIMTEFWWFNCLVG